MAEKPVVNPTPKQEFMQNTKFVSMHREMMQQPMIGVSIQYAMLEYQRQLSMGRIIDGNAAAQSFFKIQGALEFLDILRKLGESPEIPKSNVSKNQLTNQ